MHASDKTRKRSVKTDVRKGLDEIRSMRKCRGTVGTVGTVETTHGFDKSPEQPSDAGTCWKNRPASTHAIADIGGANEPLNRSVKVPVKPEWCVNGDKMFRCITLYS